MYLIHALVLFLMVTAQPATEYPLPPAPIEPIKVVKQDLTPLIEKLSLCESSDNERAINKIDKNGKSSKGVWQFQDSSWKKYVLKYGLFDSYSWNDARFSETIWQREYQLPVVQDMFLDPEINLNREFPDCSKKLHIAKTYSSLSYEFR